MPQVFFSIGPQVTQAKLVGTDQIIYFGGTVTDSPDLDRGCCSKMTVALYGDAEALWKNRCYGLHRVTCYGDIVQDLERFGRFTDIKLVNEAV